MVTLDIKLKVENIYHVDLYLKTMNISEQLVKEGLACIEPSNLDQSLNQDKSNQLKIHKFIKTPNIEINDQLRHDVIVTTIYSPFCFYIQLSENVQEFAEFEESLQSYYTSENIDLVALKRPQVGQMCVAKYSEDERWYRATVKELDYDLKRIVVFFVDYGNEDMLPIDGNFVLKIHDKFKHYPTMALKCCLSGVKPAAEVKDFIQKQEIVDFMYNTLSDRVVAYFVGKKYTEECYFVNLAVEQAPKLAKLSDLLAEKKYVRLDEPEIAQPAHRRTSVNEKFINKLVKEQAETNLKPRSKTTSISENGDVVQPAPKFKIYSDELKLDLKTKLAIDVKVTHVETVTEFYIQLSPNEGEESAVDVLMHDLQKFYERKSNLPMPLFKPCNACVYFDDEKNKWYRARILSLLDQDHCIVSLVDFGIKKFANRATLREIYDKFLNPCCQAVVASLEDVNDEALENIDEQMHTRFKQLALNKKFLAKIRGTKQVDDDATTQSINNQGDVTMAKKTKYIINLFNEDYESLFKDFVDDINNSVSAAPSEKFKPKIRSKLEESVLDQSQSQRRSRSNVVSNELLDDYYSQKCILDDATSPFPVHEENVVKAIRKTSSPPKDQVDHMPVKTQRIQELKIETAQTKPILPVAKETKCFYYENVLDIDSKKAYSINISHFNDSSSFYAQVNELFLEFDSHYDDFQAFCEQSSKITWDKLKADKSLDKLAIAAKYTLDNVWYRARICVEDTSNNEFLGFKSNTNLNNQSHEVLIEFIDYGNRQVTSLDDIVYLDHKFSNIKPCSVKCDGVSYVSSLPADKINAQLIQNLLMYGKLPEADAEPVPINWEKAYFTKINGGKFFLEIDELYKLFYSLKLVDTSFYLDPTVHSENILKQANEKEIQTKMSQLYADHKSLSKMVYVTFDAVIANLSSGLKYIYVNLAQSLDELQMLESELENEPRDSLVKLTLQDLAVNRFYLANHNNKLCRVMTLSDSKVQLIDHGNRLTIQDVANLEFYVLTPRYFKFKSFALHCRLAMGSNIEKFWTKDEELRFTHQILAKKQFKIKLLSLYEPYIIEIDESSKIDFQFKPIIERINKRELCLEPPTILYGNRIESFENEFYLGGNFFKISGPIKLNLFDGPHLREKFSEQQLLTLSSKRLMEQFKFYSNYFNESIKLSANSESNEIAIKSLNKGDIVLSKTKSASFLSSLRPDVRELIQNRWCRVKIKSNQDRVIRLYYCDFGLEEEFAYNESSKELDYKFAKLLPLAKVIPKLLFECNLDKWDLEAKLKEAVKQNDFIDFNYMNNKVDVSFLSSRAFKVNFAKLLSTPTLSNESSDVFTVDVYNKKSNKNIIDSIVDKAVRDLGEHMFTCILTHVNSTKDFYIQKYDPISEEILAELQQTIQDKVLENKLASLERVEPNKLCVSFYEVDSQYYRAKIINLSENKPFSAAEHKEKMVEVFYIDYGNSSWVRADQLKEITFDLIENLPKAFAINCELKLDKELNQDDYDEFNAWFLGLTEDMDSKYEVRCLKRKAANKYNDSGFYEVEMLDHLGESKLFDVFQAKRQTDATNLTTLTKADDLSNDSTMDDRAIADSLTINKIDETSVNATNATAIDPFNCSQIPARDATIMSNFDVSKRRDQPSANPSQSVVKEQTWFETPPHLKNYNAIETTIQTSMNYGESAYNNETSFNENSFKTRLSYDDPVKETKENKLSSDELDTTLTGDTAAYDENKSVFETSKKLAVADDEVYLKNCSISYLDSHQCFFIQAENFKSEMDRLQPEIDECLEPFDLSLSNKCIGMFNEDQKFYRCQCLEWHEETGEAKCVFIDYGNWDMVSIDTVTEMSSDLKKIKPLALNCKLDIDLSRSEDALNFLQGLIDNGVSMNVKMTKKDLNAYYEASTVYESPIKVELYSNEDKILYPTNYDQVEIKTEPESFIKEAKKSTKSSCGIQDISRSPKDDDNDKDDCNRHRNVDLTPSSTHFSSSSSNKPASAQSQSSNNSTNPSHKYANKEDSLEFDMLKRSLMANDPIVDEGLNIISSPDENQEEIENIINEENLGDGFVSQKPEDYFFDRSQTNKAPRKLDSCENNQTVCKFLNEESTWSLSEPNEKNLTVSRLNDEEEDFMDQVSRGSDAISKEMRENKNKTIEDLPDETNWTRGYIEPDSTVCDEKIQDKNKTVEELPDETNWTRSENDSRCNFESSVRNIDLSRMPDEGLNWTQTDANTTVIDNRNKTLTEMSDETNWEPNEAESIHVEDNKNITKSRMEEESMWDRSYIAKSINEQNASVWSEDQNKSTFQFKKNKTLSQTADLDDFIVDRIDKKLKDLSKPEKEPEYEEILEGSVLYIKSFENFYVQVDNADEKLMSMRIDIDRTVNKNDKIPPPGSLCIAVFPPDNQCYRAKVIESQSLNISLNTSVSKQDPKVKVLCYDYGNEEWVSVSNLYRMSTEHKNASPLALNCRLNYSSKLKSWLKQQQNSVESIESLLKTFKKLVSKSKVVAKVLKRNHHKTNKDESDLVDLFIGQDNICDLLVLNSISITKPIQIATIDSTTQLDTNTQSDCSDFDSFVINLNKFKQNSIEIKLINESIVRSMDNLCTRTSNQSKCDELYSLAPIPDPIRVKFALKNRFGRVYVKETKHSASSDLVLVHFVDFDAEIWINKIDLIKADKKLSIQFQSAIQRFNLDMRNSADLIHLSAFQVEHLFEIFKLLINYKSVESKLRKDEILELKGWSTRLNTALVESSTNRLNSNSDFGSVRLIDPLRENLDVNYIMESCLSLMLKPFRGHLIHLENDFSHFDCVHELSDSAIYSFEIKKIFKSTMSSSSTNGELTNGHANGKQPERAFKPGQLCLVDCSKSNARKKSLLPTSNSILSLSGHAIEKEESEENDETDCSSDLDLFRGIIIDETTDKCVLLNVDTGKSLTVTKRRLKPIKSFSDDSDNAEMLKKKSSYALAKLLPFLVIKAKPEKEITSMSVKRSLNKSQYYGEKIDLNVIGSWVFTYSNETSASSAFEQANYNKEQAPYFRFLQTEKDLFKLVDMSANEIEQQLKENEKLDQLPKMVSKSSISIQNSANIKRKRSEGPDDKLSRRPALSGELNHAIYYTLSHFKSVNCFYLHSSETSKTLELIQDLMQLEYESDESALKVSAPKLNSIYGIYSHKDTTYYRIRLLNYLQTNKLPARRISNAGDDLSGFYDAFYVDYGFTDRVASKDLLMISDVIQQIPPQARCCRLYGFQTVRDEFADAEETEPTRANESNETDLKKANLAFIHLLKDKKFMATIYKRFALQNLIDNQIPLQSDISKPIEIAIHVYKEGDEESDSLNSSINFINVLNGEKTANQSRNLTLIIKKMIDKETKSSSSSRRASLGGQTLIPIKRRIQFSLFDLVKQDKKEADVQIGHVVNANQFYVHLSNWKSEMTKLNELMARDYNPDSTLVDGLADSSLPHLSFTLSQNAANLTDKELRIGLLCAIVNKNESVYRRALIVDLPKKKLNNKPSNTSVYLIDFGKYVTTSTENLFNLLDKYYDIEPLCFQCTLGIDAPRALEEQVNNQLSSLILLYKSFRIGLIEELKSIHSAEASSILLNRYRVKLFGVSQDKTVNISDQLSFFAQSLSTSSSLPKNAFLDSIKTTPELNNIAAWDKLVKKPETYPFNETEMPLGQQLRIKLTDVDTVNYFGVVLCCQKEKRERFVQRFNQWHKENRTYLKSLIYDGKNSPPECFVGMPCAFSSVQMSKWCRGVVIHIEANCVNSYVYLVDYGKVLHMGVDRLFKLEKEEFLNEPTYVHRCQLVDEQGQRDSFEKYLDLLKSNTSLNDSDEINESKSHISIDNIEINIACIKREMTPLKIKYNPENYQYTVRVNDYKRIKPALNTSKLADRSSLQPNRDSSYNSSVIQILNKDRVFNESAENTLCDNGLHDNFPNKQQYYFNNSVVSTSIVSYGSSSIKLPDINHDTKNLEDRNENNFTMYAISESTRIQQDDKENNTYDDIEDITQTNETADEILNQFGNYINGNLLTCGMRGLVDKREDTSNWLQNLEDNDDNKFLASRIDVQLAENSKVRVKILSFNGQAGFICQKLDLLKHFERLQADMNEYYKKINQSTKSVESEKQNGKQHAELDAPNDSLDGDISSDSSFKVGDYCACYIGTKWSRCRITSKSNHFVSVESVDDYRTQRVHINKVEKLLSNFKFLPRVAFKCQFEAIRNAEKLFRLNVNATANFTKLIQEESSVFVAEIVEITKGENDDDLCLVKLYMNNKDVMDIITNQILQLN